MGRLQNIERETNDTLRSLYLRFWLYAGIGKLGAWGEFRAEKYLVTTGAIIWCRNWRCRFGEIDLVALYQRRVVFVEVKTRMEGLPEAFSARAALKDEKIAQVSKLSATFIKYNGKFLKQLRIREYQFDFIAVTARRSLCGNFKEAELAHESGVEFTLDRAKASVR